MSRSCLLTVVVPRLIESSSQASTDRPGPSVLARIAGRGCLRLRWDSSNERYAHLASWQYALLEALELDAGAHPSAPLTARGAHFMDRAGDWLHAEPIHLAAGLNDVALVPLRGELALTSAERAALAPMLAEHLAIHGLVFCETPEGQWLIGSATPWRVQTVSAEFAQANEWDRVLPRGEDASLVRRTMTELQMLLHEHPVNRARAARGAPEANSVWLWGNGSVPTPPQQRNVATAGIDDYLDGICDLHGWLPPQGIESAQHLLRIARAQPRVIAVLREMRLDELEASWLRPIEDALWRGPIGHLRLIVDGWEIVLDRWTALRFWRRAQTMEKWGKV